MDRIGGPHAGLMWSRPSQVSRLPGNPVRFPYSQVIPASIPSELSDTEGCERALASPWSLSDEVNLEDQAVRLRCGTLQRSKSTARRPSDSRFKGSETSEGRGPRNGFGVFHAEVAGGRLNDPVNTGEVHPPGRRSTTLREARVTPN